jgi:tRNA A-37 threonylcarbamoyl transferase component Bud32
MEKIPTKFSTLERVVQNRPDVIADQVSTAWKNKWPAQIEYTLLELHNNGLVWGDARPGNVIIDSDDNAWLIDLVVALRKGMLTPIKARVLNWISKHSKSSGLS